MLKPSYLESCILLMLLLLLLVIRWCLLLVLGVSYFGLVKNIRTEAI
jgi:hypothetical protein